MAVAVKAGQYFEVLYQLLPAVMVQCELETKVLKAGADST